MPVDSGERATDPLASSALRFSVMATALLLVAAAVGASVRLLPWVLDPRIGKETLAPFAKSLAVIAIEVALLTGWPMGWALAAYRLVDRGEARVLASLGESPLRSAERLVPQGVAFAVILALTSFSLGRMSASPGQIVDGLLQEGHRVCAAASSPTSNAVPFVSATWLCGTGTNATPRLVGRSPLGGIVFTASAARVSDDLRRIELDDARLRLEGPAGVGVHVRVGSLTLRGLAPFTAASPLAPAGRALVVVLAGAGAALAAVVALLRARHRTGYVVAAALGALGPTTSLGALRALELRMPEHGALGPGWLALLAAVPLLAIAVVLGAAALASAISAARAARAGRRGPGAAPERGRG